MEVPKSLSENMDYRIDLVDKSLKDPKMQAILMEQCA